VGQFAAGIDGQRVVEGEFLAALGEAFLLLVASLRTIMVTPATHHVEVFKREAGRIHLRVARGAGFLRAMLFELLADRRRATDVRVNRSDAGGWRRQRLSEDTLHDP